MTTSTHYISTYCHITPQQVSVDGVVLHSNTSETFENFLKQLYKEHSCRYPKFFKMDTMSKLAFMGAEFLLKSAKEATTEVQNTALVFSNKSSSLETDRKHQESIASETEFYPSPAVFVYTLPNIGIGEVAIRHQLQTENAFFVFESFEANFLQKYTVSLLREGKCNSALCGWVEVDKTENHGFFYLVEATGKWQHTEKNITTFYNKI